MRSCAKACCRAPISRATSAQRSRRRRGASARQRSSASAAGSRRERDEPHPARKLRSRASHHRRRCRSDSERSGAARALGDASARNPGQLTPSLILRAHPLRQSTSARGGAGRTVGLAGTQGCSASSRQRGGGGFATLYRAAKMPSRSCRRFRRRCATHRPCRAGRRVSTSPVAHWRSSACWPPARRSMPAN